MQTIHNDAVRKLFEQVEILENEPHESWRCVYLKIRNRKDQSKSDLYASFIKRPVSNLLLRYNGSIYFCKDGDIFVLFQGVLNPILAILERHFSDFDLQMNKAIDEGSHFRIFEYDLGKNWETFYSVCQAKFLDVLAASEMARNADKELSTNLHRVIKPIAKSNKQSVLSKVPFHVLEQAVSIARDA